MSGRQSTYKSASQSPLISIVFKKGPFVLFIQGDPGGKASILGGDNIGLDGEKSSFEQMSNSEWLWS